MANQNNNSGAKTVVSIIVWVLILLLLGGAMAAIIHFTNGGSEDFKTFYLVHDGKDLMTAHSYAYYEQGEQRFDVKYTFGLGDDEKDYNVKIVPNADADFDLFVEQERSAWSSVGELNQVFALKKETTYFTFTIPEEKSVKEILGKLYPDDEVTAPAESELPSPAPYLYSLIVSSYNESVTFRIDFSLIEIIRPDRITIEGDLVF